MKIILSLIISGALVVSGFGQTRNVLVGTNNVVVQPTNFWSADASNARSGLGLGSAATNQSSAFQPSSTTLSNLSSGSFIISITNGGTGASNAATARTNLGLGWSALTNTDATNFRTAIGLGTTNTVTFSNVVILGNVSTTNVISTATNFNVGGTLNVTNKAETRTNLGLGATWLTNTDAPVFVNTNGEVVSPTNFWAVAPISTTVQYQTNVTGTSTNAATNSRNLFLFSLSPSVSAVTNTVTLPTNTATTFEGDRATITHLAQTNNAVTAIRQLGAATNLITLNQIDETVLLMYRSGAWRLADNISYIEPIYFSGTNAAANVAASRANLNLGWPALTNSNSATTLLGYGTNGTVVWTNTNTLTFTNRGFSWIPTAEEGYSQYSYSFLSDESSQNVTFYRGDQAIFTIDTDSIINFHSQVDFDVNENALSSLGVDWAASIRPIRSLWNVGDRPVGDLNYNTIPLEGTNAEANGGVFEILKGTNVNRTALVVAGARNVIELWNTYGNVSFERPDTYLEGPLSGSSIGARPNSTNRSVSEFNVSLVSDYNSRQSVMTLTGTNAEFEIPLGFVGGNAATNAAQTRTNLGLGSTNNVTFSNVTASGTLTATGTVTTATNLVVNGFVDFTTARTNSNPATNNQINDFIEIRVGTNQFWLPVYK
jgi:hypothetical protein